EAPPPTNQPTIVTTIDRPSTTEIEITIIDTETTTEIEDGFSLFEMAKYHSIAVNSDNEVYGWGDNTYGQLGQALNSSEEIVNLTHYFELWPNEYFVDIALGDFHSSILTSYGRVYSWGSNTHGQMGDGTYLSFDMPIDNTKYYNIDEGERIIDIESGAGHMIALTSDGRVLSWGYNENGQVGAGPDETIYNYSNDITDLLNLGINEEVIKIDTGYENSAVLTSQGRLISWGYNIVGQLGNGTTDNVYFPTDHTEFIPLVDGENIIDIELGYYHTAVLTSNHRILVWGLNDHGQAGNRSEMNLLLPTDITENFNLDENDYIESLSFGGWSSSAISQFGQVFMWGANGQGRLALPEQKNFTIPTNILGQFDLYRGEVIVDVILGGWSSSAITSYGRLFTWGMNSTFQLGSQTNQEFNDEPIEISIE
ncbi:MAG TPA: hypothetical protein VJ878_01935, partial [Candidatus Izemoplasmatales bacterium]|nr:hypothetical protein [Candidatus Izemoplasmatales bacterium]